MKTRYGNRELLSIYNNSSIKTSLFNTLNISSTKNIDYTKYNGIWDLQSTNIFPQKQLAENSIRVIDTTINVNNSSVSSINAVVPSSVIAGDLILIIVGNSSFVAGSPVYLFGTTYKPSGFTHIYSNNIYSSITPKVAAYYKYATGSEANSIISCPAGSSGKMFVSCMIIRNVKQSSPIRTYEGNYADSGTSIFFNNNFYLKNSILLNASIILGTNYSPFRLHNNDNPTLKQYYEYNTDDTYYVNNPQEKISSNITGVVSYAISKNNIINSMTMYPQSSNPNLGARGTIYFIIDGV